jgi:hypothetical protein
MAFVENKGRSDKKREDKLKEKGAVWHDPSVDKLKVNIEDKSRLRKLKKTEDETHISGD